MPYEHLMEIVAAMPSAYPEALVGFNFHDEARRAWIVVGEDVDVEQLVSDFSRTPPQAVPEEQMSDRDRHRAPDARRYGTSPASCRRRPLPALPRGGDIVERIGSTSKTISPAVTWPTSRW